MASGLQAAQWSLTCTTTGTIASKGFDHRDRNFVVLSFDEFGPVQVRPEKGSNWAKETHPDRVPATYHKNEGVKHLLSSYDLTNDEMHAHMRDRKTNVEFLAFMKYVRSLYPVYVLIYLVLDNFSPHVMDRVLLYALENNIAFALTPTNASWLNPIESQFTPLRKFAISNCNPGDHREIGTNVRRYVAWRNRHHTPPKRVRRKRVRKERSHLCGKCGVEIL